MYTLQRTESGKLIWLVDELMCLLLNRNFSLKFPVNLGGGANREVLCNRFIVNDSMAPAVYHFTRT